MFQEFLDSGSGLLSEEKSLPILVFQLNSLDDVHDLFQKSETRKGDGLLGATSSGHTTCIELNFFFFFCQELSVKLRKRTLIKQSYLSRSTKETVLLGSQQEQK